MPVRILVTGGTFDKEYNEITGELYFEDTHMREILELGRSKLEVKIRTLMLIDSLDMTDEDWMPHCDASYKATIKFTDFHKKGESFHFPYW